MSVAVCELDVPGEVLRLVQITDTHLRETPGGTLLGLDTDFSLKEVIALVKRERSQIDLVLGTGDISDHGSVRAYQRANTYFSQLDAAVGWIVGNHDERDSMAGVLGHGGELTRVFRSNSWQVLLLDSQIAGEVGGELGVTELALLTEQLEQGAAAGLYSLVCLHHQPVAMGSAWIDDQKILDSEAFFAVLENFEHVRGVLWGHVHQQLDSERGGVALMSTPSTCIQFARGQREFKVDDEPPGYRWLDLHPDGRIDTGISRVQGVKFNVDLDSDGYL